MAAVFEPVSKSFSNGRVPFKFENDFDRSIETEVRTAIKFLEDHTPLWFDEVNSIVSLDTYIHFQHTRNPEKSHCTSKVAIDFVSSIFGGAVNLSLGFQWKSNIRIPKSGDHCNKVTFVHEILHSLGFIHEHQRPDRNEYVDVDMKLSERDIDYMKYPTGISLLTKYDYCSIMHYDVGDVRARIWKFDGKQIVGGEPSKTIMRMGSWDVYALLSLTQYSHKALLKLESSSGDYQLVRVSDFGETDLEVIDSGSWSSGWNNAKFITMGDNWFLGLYKRLTGDLHLNIVKLTASAGMENSAFGIEGIGKITFDTTIEKDFREMIPFAVGGRTYLLMIGKFPSALPNPQFMPLDPVYSIYEITPEGKLSSKVQRGQLSNDSRLTAASIAIQKDGLHLVVYNSGDGSFALHRIYRSDEGDNLPIRIGPQVHKGRLQKGLSKIEIAQLGGNMFLFGSKFSGSNSGIYVYEMSNGSLVSEVDFENSESGYETFEVFVNQDEIRIIGFRPKNQEIIVKKEVPQTEILNVEDGSLKTVDYAGQGLGVSKLDLEAINKLFG